MLMLRKYIAVPIALSLAIGLSSSAFAAPCRDAHGKFVKCAAKAAPAHCKDAKGKFAKCTVPGAKPAK